MVRVDLSKISNFDFITSLLLLKTKNDEGSGNFDARRLWSAIEATVSSDIFDKGSLDAMLSVLRMGHTIYQHSDELHTEIYYVRHRACEAITRDLEKRLGKEYLKRFETVARKIWGNYDSLASVKR